jgi:thiol-disulfide isomerase/thioredoxin
VESAVTVLIAAALFAWMFVRENRESPLIDAPAPDFRLPVAAGEGAQEGDWVRLSDLKGSVVVLDFWASWCAPCRAGVPEMSALARRLAPRGVHVLGINAEHLADGAYQALYRHWGFAYPVLRDPTGEAHSHYDIDVFPTLIVIDQRQKVRFAHAGAPAAGQLEQEIISLLE